jgi:hypothetical protein
VKTRVTFKCNACGSDNIKKDAYAEWDVEQQEWVLCTVFDDTVCDDCCATDIERVEEEVPA